ncbi:MAG: autotransporter-associated beta strand repeat-containing protein [Verrucomicrobia bacterium]|nr:autotransporter-associated beta strand repeat-containing protein [Verrucomicrobiota bacterium]
MPHTARGISGWLLMFAGTALSCSQVFAEDEKPDPAAHTVIVPYDIGKPVDPQRANRYYLDYAEFQKLWELAKENRRPAKPDDLEKGVKPEAVINSALYEAEIFEDRLHVKARLNVITRGGKWVKLPLAFQANGLAMGEVKLDGQTAAFQDGAILIEESGAHTIEIVLDVRESKGWRAANLKLPPSAAALLSLKVPSADGRPDFGDAANLVTEEIKDGRRIFTLPLGTAANLTFIRTTFLRPAGDTAPAISESSITLSILPHLEKVDAQISFDFPGVERDRFSVLLDSSLKPVSWDIPNLREWTLKEENGKLRADIRLIRPAAGTFRLSFSAERVLTATEGGRSVPLIEGVAIKQSSVFHFQTAETLQSKVEATAGVQRMESATQTSSGMMGGGAYRLQKDGKLSYTVSRAEDRSTSRIESVFQVSPQKAEIIAAITLDTGRGPLLDALIVVPAGYEVQTLAGPRVQSWHRDGGHVFVRFDSQPLSEARLVLHVAKTLPKADVTWKLEPLLLPQFKKHEGTVLIAAHAADDVKLEFDGADRKLREVDPATIHAVVSVAPPLMVKRALSIEKPDWTAKVTLTRQTPKFAVDAVLLAQATDEGLKFSQQIGVLIEQGALNSLTLRMPKDLPEARVLGALVRDAQSKVVGETRQYDVTFQADVLDRVDFSLDFELPIEGEKVLPVLQVAGASRMQEFLIVDNASSREMKTNAGGAVSVVKESLPYVPEGLLRPVFFRADDKSSVKLTFSQLESTAGNAAIVTLAEITTALRPNGERMETVVYSLANRSLQFLPVKLPAKAELIEVSVGGQNVRADVGGSEKMYLVPLIQMRPGELSQQVRLVYRLPALEKNLATEQMLDDPELVGLSAERTLWNVWLPEKFAMKKWDGNMEEVPEVVVEDEKQMQKVSDAARLNRLLLSGNLGERDVKEAWGNANKALDEVKSYQAKKRSGAKPREMNDPKAAEQREQQALKYDLELEKQLDTQGTLLSRNGEALNKATEQPQAKVKTGKDANANWKGQEGGQTIVINPNNTVVGLNGGNVVNFNDNVQVDQNFLAQGNTSSSSLTMSGSGNLTLSGENTYKGTTTVSAGTLTVPNSPKPKAEPPAQPQALVTNNARASQAATYPQGQVADASGIQLGSGNSGGLVQNGSGVLHSVDGPSRASVLNAPTVTTRSGAKATVEVIREFIYPSESNPAQLKPVGRVSLAVQVPLEGRVYHFRKLKDHAQIEMDVKRPLTSRQTGALWVMGIGLAALALFEFARRAWSKRRRVVAL